MTKNILLLAAFPEHITSVKLIRNPGQCYGRLTFILKHIGHSNWDKYKQKPNKNKIKTKINKTIMKIFNSGYYFIIKFYCPGYCNTCFGVTLRYLCFGPWVKTQHGDNILAKQHFLHFKSDDQSISTSS